MGLNLSDIPIPDVVVENIEIKRVLDGSEWVLLSPRAEHKQGMIYGQSVDITVTAENGEVSKMFAANGVFSRESSDITLESMSADVKHEKKNISMRAGMAFYNSSEDIWYFSEDVSISDGSATASGPEGSYSAGEGLSLITGGGTVTWVN